MNDHDAKKPAIEFRDFGFQYRAQSEPTLHAINLTIYEGEKVLIVGPSGSGKSTLGHCINGLAPFFYPGRTTGSLKIRGRETSEMSLYRLSTTIGTVLQDPDGQFVGLTVAEDIAFRMENEGVPRAEMKERVAAAARQVGMEGQLAASPHALSGGQKQRTTLAGALASDAPILLFDEPLANLDPQAGRHAIELIDRIHAETGRTIVIIEHRLEDVLHRGVDRVIVVSDGRIAADLAPNELLCSNLLRETGIREPLYLTALRYAGCELTPELDPQHVGALRLERCAERLRAWDERPSPPGAAEAEAVGGEAPPLLELAGIGFAYDRGRPILRDISLKAARGEVVGIVGRNGAGKSTLSKLVCGFHKPTAGRIALDGRDIGGDTIKERAGRIGFVMQNPNHMISKPIVFEEVALGLRTRGVGTEETAARVQEALKVCGLHAFRNWPVSALSFGQKKRVTIASILVLNPEILILDEPTAGQDFKHYNEMMEFLLGLNRSGLTVFMITHDMHLLLEYADRAVVLSEGTVLADDRPDRILTNRDIVTAADLKMTSLQELADRAGLAEPQRFVSRFIEYDRRSRGR